MVILLQQRRESFRSQAEGALVRLDYLVDVGLCTCVKGPIGITFVVATKMIRD